MTTATRELVDEVTELLYEEAELADANAYDEWLALWDDECLYWVPCNTDEYDPAHHVSIIYDDRARLEQRCFRLTTGGAHAQEPASRSCRVLGNVRVGPEVDGVVEATARVIIVELRLGRKSTYAARVAYRLRRTDDGLRLAEKKVMLLDADEPLGNMTFLI